MSGPGRSLFVLVLAYALLPAVFLLDYQHFGPIVRFGPFTAWTMAALGMPGYAAGQAFEGRSLLSGVAWAFLAGGTLLAGGLSLVFLPIILIASSPLFTCLGVGLIGTGLVYGRRLAAALPARPRGGAWHAGLAAGAIAFIGLPMLVEEIHDRYFDRRLAGLSAADPRTRADTLQSLIGSRFCWSSCTRAVCDARADLDADAVKAVLGTGDVELVCTEPGVSEWPG